MKIEDIHPSAFHYDLPDDRIASHPLSDRTSSKLLHYTNGEISHLKFSDFPELLNSKTLVVFNDSKVIPARLIFEKSTGARIEIFLLEPTSPGRLLEKAMACTLECTWNCMIGNAKKWKSSHALKLDIPEGPVISATRTGEREVHFHWGTDHTFSELLSTLGKTPLPPYIKRQPGPEDTMRYQTVYSKVEGAVAAPTAGLHFSEKMISRLSRDHTLDYVTLHVSAGTFQPITESVGRHKMHREQIVISRTTIENLLKFREVTAIGTTSMRSLESLYWYGVYLMEGGTQFEIEKLFPYGKHRRISRHQSLEEILNRMNRENLESITGHTELIIAPGYQFQICNGLMTNFHIPGSTLLMLIAAFTGNDWREVYSEALEGGYRFLSYGDTSYLKP